MTKEENLVKQLFIGKVSAILGFDKTLELLKEANDISKKYKHNIVKNNNGWIKIESEDDLPKEEKDYWVVDSDGEVFICFFDTDYKAFTGYFHYDQKGKITHYQPIEKPKTPIY